MFQVKEESMQHLMDASEKLHRALTASPLWYMLSAEPVIVDWCNALAEIESQLKLQEKNELPTQ